VNIGGEFEADALDVLRDVPGVTVEAQPRVGDHRPDAIVRFADREETVLIEVKRQANAATAWQLVHYAEQFPEMPVLLIADTTTDEARKILIDHGIGFIDGLRNAHIELPGLLFHLEGRGRKKSAAGPAPPTRLSGKAGAAAQALLLHPEREWTVRDLAEEAGVAAGLAHRVLARLEREGVMATRGTGPQRVRTLANPTALLDLWAEEQADQPKRTLGYLLAQTPRQLAERLASGLERAGIEYAITGAAGANFVAPFLTAIPLTDVWVAATAAPDEVLRHTGADAVAEGQNLVLLQAKDNTPLLFRREVNDVWVANPFRLFVDLRRDPRRGREQADHLREEVIGF
jgi:hypothetical protein